MSSRHRTFPFRVRPLHRETLNSYTSRILAANFEPATLPADLVREARQEKQPTTNPEDWLSILTTKTGRQLRLTADPTGWCNHADGDGCKACVELIHQRWLCTRCAHGNRIAQYPHFDAPICARHGRWVGITTAPEGQHQVGAEHTTATRKFTKLRKSYRLDARLYLSVSTALMNANTPKRTESDVFPAAIRIIAAVTSREFASTFFDPSARFEDRFAILRDTVESTYGFSNARITRALWVYFRPTVASLRHAAELKRPFEPTSPHDYPAVANISASASTAAVAVQPFTDYLRASRDTLTTALTHELEHLAHLAVDTDGRLRQLICPVGHAYSSRLLASDKGVSQCPACRNNPPHTYDDLRSAAPHLVNELNPALNGGLAAEDISASSTLKLAWTCARGHTYVATPASRTTTNSTCPVCTKRVVVAGVNDLATTNRMLASEFHPSEYPRRATVMVAAGSTTNILWLCAEGHSFRAPIAARAAGQNCPTCTTAAKHASARSLMESHPDIAKQWHPTRNYPRSPADYVHGSRNLAWWVCDDGHEYSQRIERRTVAGNGCPICSRQKVSAAVDSLDTTTPILTLEWHPTRNKRKASETMSIKKPYIWKCLAKGHEHMQTVDQRRKSLGCPLCPQPQRILSSQLSRLVTQPQDDYVWEGER